MLGGVVGAAIVAMFAGAIGDALDGAGQEVLNGAILLVAAGMLGWHTVWMARHGRELATEMKALGRGVADGSRTLAALAIVVGAAVLREGAEVVLFLYGIVVGGDGAGAVLLGSLVGLAGGAVVSFLLYRGLVAIPTRHLFGVTNTLLAFMAAGMASQGVGFLIQGDVLPGAGGRMWDSAWLLDEKSLVGRVLHALAGYTDHPAGLQLLVYAVLLAGLLLGTRALGRTAGPARA